MNLMKNIILTCNAGSNNTKLAVFDLDLHRPQESLSVHTIDEIRTWLKSKTSQDEKIVAIAHRVVHGGRAFTQPEYITDESVRTLTDYIPLAPLHQGAALKIIEIAREFYPDIAHIACFDTAFHHTMPEINRHFPLPQKYYDEGILRYGFHGLSYNHIANLLPEYAPNIATGRIIAVHLGGGASACAMKNLESIDNTMGFSTLDGLMMGTRCGALDVGVLLYLLQEKKLSVSELSDLLYHKAGLKGVSGIRDNMQDLLNSSLDSAKKAIELYCMLAAKQIAGLIPSIGGLDALVFTGGIGENSEIIREKITKALHWVGEFKVFVIPADEELIMAKACKKFLESKKAILQWENEGGHL